MNSPLRIACNDAIGLSRNDTQRMSYTLATAAEAAGVSKPTVFRWIKAGRLSATRADDGSYRIDPAELHRYLDANATKAVPVAPETLPAATVQRPDTAAEADPEVLQANVALRSEVEKLKALLEMERQRAVEWKEEAGRWASQAERLAIAPPASTTVMAQPRWPAWWPFRQAG